LATAQRLRRRGDFAAAVRAGRRAARGALVVHVKLPDPAAPPAPSARAGFVVPKTVGGATVRNLVKRRLRHLVRELLPALPPGTDVVVRALPGAALRPYHDLRGDLTAALDAARRPKPAR
jgi:ribonuclease P protein component